MANDGGVRFFRGWIFVRSDGTEWSTTDLSVLESTLYYCCEDAGFFFFWVDYSME